ncbi:MAG: hypothetical protein ACRCVV_21825 [Shewanella sp.]
MSNNQKLKDLKIVEHFIELLAKLGNNTPKNERLPILMAMFEASLEWAEANLTEVEKRSLLNSLYGKLMAYMAPQECLLNAEGRMPHPVNKSMCLHGVTLNTPCIWCDSKVPF